MKKEVVISLLGTQQDGENKESVDYKAKGTFYKKGEAYYITYKESEQSGMEGVTTTVKVEGCKVTVMRFGTLNTQLVFECGKRHLCTYETMYGALMVGITSDNVTVDIDETGGEIRADYKIDVDENTVGINSFHMQIRECQ